MVSWRGLFPSEMPGTAAPGAEVPTPKIFTLRVLRPVGGLRIETEFRCDTIFDEQRFDRLVRRLAQRNRVQVWWGSFCVDTGSSVMDPEPAIFP